MAIEDCHARLFPINETELVTLVRYQNTIYKFTVKNGSDLERFMTQHGVLKLQRKIEKVILYLIEMQEDNPAEIHLSSSEFKAKIYLHPWYPSGKICFKSELEGKIYQASSLQYTINMYNTENTPTVDERVFDFLSRELETQLWSENLSISSNKSTLHNEISHKPKDTVDANDNSSTSHEKCYKKPKLNNVECDTSGQMEKNINSCQEKCSKSDKDGTNQPPNMKSSKLETKCLVKDQGFLSRICRFIWKK